LITLKGKLKSPTVFSAFVHVDWAKNLAVPHEAVLDTGIRKIVYINLGDGEIQTREVELGPQALS